MRNDLWMSERRVHPPRCVTSLMSNGSFSSGRVMHFPVAVENIVVVAIRGFCSMQMHRWKRCQRKHAEPRHGCDRSSEEPTHRHLCSMSGGKRESQVRGRRAIPQGAVTNVHSNARACESTSQLRTIHRHDRITQ